MIVCEDIVTRHLKNGKKESGFYMDNTLKANLDFAAKRRDKKWDNVALYVGDEGSGKTTMASQDCKLLDKDFKLDNICFNKKQILWALDSLPQGSSIQFDEFALEGSAGDLGSVQKIIIKKITTIRKRRLSIRFVVSFPWMLKTYFVMRAQNLIRTYSPDNLDRGFFRFYSRPRMRKMYFFGMQTNHKWEFLSNYDFHGRFPNTEGLFFNPEQYEAKKDEAIGEIGQIKTSVRETNIRIKMAKLIRLCKERDITSKDMAVAMGTTDSNISKIENRGLDLMGAHHQGNAPKTPEDTGSIGRINQNLTKSTI